MAITGVVASEDVLVLPEAWRQFVHPRRGGAVIRPFTVDPEAHARTGRRLAERRGRLSAVLAAVSTPETVRAAAARWLAGEPDPAGAAAVAAVLGGAEQSSWADVWIGAHGLRFAAVAAVETASMLIIDDRLAESWRYHPEADSGVRHRRPDDPLDDSPLGLRLLLRVRAALAAAPEEEFERVLAALEPYRAGSVYARAACSVLLPRADWVEPDVADADDAGDHTRCAMLLYSASTAAQVATLAPMVSLTHAGVGRDLFVTIADGVGAAAAPALFRWFDGGGWEFTDRGTGQRLLSVLAIMPGDEVMHGLLARSGQRIARNALREAAERFPARAMRILAEQGDELLPVHVTKHQDLVDRVMPLLSPVAGGRVRAVVQAWDDVVTAPPSAVPPVLADPPWRDRGRTVRPPVVAGLRCTDPARVHWLAGEREEWAQTYVSNRDEPSAGWPALAATVLAGSGRWDDAGRLFTQAPEEVARPALAHWQPRTDWDSPRWLRVAASRFETDALPALVSLARATPGEYGAHLMPFTSPVVATLMADWSARLKSMRRPARQWLLRHPGAAARALIPAALAKAGTTPRRQAERALLLLHGDGHTETIRAAAAEYGPEAAAGVEALLAADPLAALPARMPSVPGWAAPGVLPPVRLRDGSAALPAEAVTNLVLMLMISKPDEPYAGLAPVREAVESAGLAEFGWALFQLWQTAGGASRDSWAFDAVGLTGNDEIVHRLTPMILSWPGEGLHARAIAGLSVLVGIGTDQALLSLHRISQRARSTPLRRAAAARITEIADGLGLTADQLADRLVPDFGLEPDGSLHLDYGSRRFTVGFDEQLRPFVVDEGGRRLKALPKPGARDDAELGAAAYQRFTVLKREVRKVAAEQVRRLEEAMVAGRRWTVPEFQRLFAAHPLMWHIARRLVWSRFPAGSTATDTPRPDSPDSGTAGTTLGPIGDRPADTTTGTTLGPLGDRPADTTLGPIGDRPARTTLGPDSDRAARTTTGTDGDRAAGTTAGPGGDGWGSVGALRIAEDRSFADVDDEPVVLGDGELLGVAHPVRLGAETDRWAEMFGDYEILQPFPQLGRPVFALTEAEREGSRLTRFEGVTVATTTVLTLDRRGWRRQEADDNGFQTAFDRPAGPGRVLTVHLDPGLLGQVGFEPEQRLVAVYLHDGTVSPWSLPDDKTRPLRDLDPVIASEILRDLTDVTT